MTTQPPGRRGEPSTQIGSLGEFGLIERVTKLLGAPAPPLGPGDDAAVIPAPDGWVVASTDLLVEGRHFRFDWSSGYDVGRKAAAQNLADIAAMGAQPTALLVGFAAPASFEIELADGIIEGLRDEAAGAGAWVVGGDVVRATSELTLAVTALGDLQGRAPITRAGAAPGDLVVLAGTLGRSSAGLALLQRGITDGPLVDAHRCPVPPYAAGIELARLGATSMIDISDGLAADAGHVATASGCRFNLESAVFRPERGVTLHDILYGGEDHALLATVPAGTETRYPVIGQVSVGTGVWVDGGRVSGGWDHFA